MNNLAVIGIHTGIGKTVASAVLVEAMEADYWKPIQAGDLKNSDTIVVKKLVTNQKSFFHPEAYRLQLPMSPHAAAQREGFEIKLLDIMMPESKRKIVVETAGGLLSPINQTQTNLDLVLHLKLPVVLVSKNYLGSLNHTLLTCSVLKQNNILVKGIIFNGIPNPETESFIEKNTGIKILFSINEEPEISKEVIKSIAIEIKDKLNYL